MNYRSRHSRSARWMVLLGVLALTAAVVGCGKHGGSGGGQVLRYPIQVEPSTLDPARLSDVYTSELLWNVYDGLVIFDKDGRVVPDLAERWDVSPDGRTYTFHLSPRARFHNGRLLTADDVKYSVERALQPATASPVAANYLAPIIGSAEVAAGKRTDLPGVRVVNAQTLEIRIDQPRGYFLGMLAYPTGWVVCREAVKKAKAEGRGFDESASIGTGPFKLAEYRHGAKVTLAVNPDYFQGRPRLDRVERPIVLDFQTAHFQFEGGQTDFCTSDPTNIAADRADPRLREQALVLPYAEVQYIAMLPSLQPAFRNPSVRRAIAEAIDRDDIINRATHGLYQAAKGFVPPGVPGYNPALRAAPFDPADARRLLASAGFPGGRNFPHLTLVYQQKVPEIEAAAGIIRDDLKNNIGISIDLQPRETATLVDDTNKEKVPFYMLGWIADYLDPQDFLSTLLRTGAPLNHVGYRNPHFDALCDQADTLTDMDRRIPLYQQADQIEADDTGVVSLWYQKLLYLKKPYVRDLAVNAMMPLPLRTVHLGQ